MIAKFSELQGVTLVRIDQEAGRIVFTANDGRRWSMHHDQDCCESVTIDDIIGDLVDLLGAPIIVAEERVSSDAQDGQDTEYAESFTWTFYEMRTIKGSVTIRWFGESNGYYSEAVDVELIDPHPIADAETWILALSRGRPDCRYQAYFELGGS